MAGKGGEKEKKSSKKQGTEDTDTAESDLVAQLANAVVKDEKRRVKDGVKARRKGGKAKKKISESPSFSSRRHSIIFTISLTSQFAEQ